MNRDRLIKLLGDLFFTPDYRVEYYDVTTGNDSIEISSFLNQGNSVRCSLRIYNSGEVVAVKYTTLEYYGIPNINYELGIPNKLFELEFLVDRHKNLLFN